MVSKGKDSKNKEKLDEVLETLKKATEATTIERFTNNLEFNKSCLLISIIFLLLFIYKKEVMNFFK